MDNIKTLWIIPARGGSKGIPGKNIRDFCGMPLIVYSINHAKECAASDDIIFVSTDSEKIKDIVEKTGLKIPFMRPDELATDHSSTYDVIMHALDEFGKRGKTFDRVVLLQPTSPLRETEDVKNALSAWSPDVDMVVSVTPAKANPYYNAFETDSDGFLHISKGDGTITRRQDAPEVWEYNGAVYVMTVDALKRGPISSFKKIIPSPMPQERSVDLDSPLDWIIAETIFKNKRTEN